MQLQLVFAASFSAVHNIGYFSPEVQEDLASQNQLCNTIITQANCAALEQLAIGTSH
ncbi:MAG: hypothetical protein KME59_15845 [Trichormus sp. ATA11-4-KO1]|jgi:hypothetical protein|nr:hypothetical protein [Trichormus sp. ATA11-4-KO1]